jgi:hypothetical protein
VTKTYPDTAISVANMLGRGTEMLSDPGTHVLTLTVSPSANPITVRPYRLQTSLDDMPTAVWIASDPIAVGLGETFAVDGPIGGPTFPPNAVKYASGEGTDTPPSGSVSYAEVFIAIEAADTAGQYVFSVDA